MQIALRMDPVARTMAPTKPKTIRLKYSAGPNSNASSVSGGAKAAMSTVAKHPAMKLPPAVNLLAVTHYLEVLDFQKEIIEKIRNARLNGFTHYMVVVAEGAGSAYDVAKKIKEEICIEPRVTVLGHIQRGGTPTARDRVTATRMGYRAVDILASGGTNRVICINDGRMCDIDIEEGLALRKGIDQEEWTVLEAMTGV